jgi:hypothetical protein
MQRRFSPAVALVGVIGSLVMLMGGMAQFVPGTSRQVQWEIYLTSWIFLGSGAVLLGIAWRWMHVTKG